VSEVSPFANASGSAKVILPLVQIPEHRETLSGVISMRLPRIVSIGTILLAGHLLVGCDPGVTGMKGMKQGTGPAEDMSIRDKTGRIKKEFPPIPPDAEAPPMKRQ
jgi:hypothetical protein